MPEYCTCGAKLPPDARFCHKCAKPQYDYPGTDDAQIVSEPPPLPVPPPLPTALAAPEINFRNRIAVKIGFLAALLAVLATGLITFGLSVSGRSVAWILRCRALGAGLV